MCDGCALGVAGFHDWTMDSVHLCMTRLNLLRLNTMPALDPEVLRDISKLATLSNAQLRELGRLPYPMVREKGAPGFRRISWNEALQRIAGKIRSSPPNRVAFFLTSRGVTNEVYTSDYLFLFILLASGLLPGILWWYLSFHKVTYFVALTQHHGHPEMYLYRGWSKELMEEMSQTLHEVVELPYQGK